ncbi:acid type B receptor subunit 2 [Seminavis robusta]|uniref:Acid type B receptor subunit 2 n=1 Tax=Seminavis robusta TaxID=568900 RepID=A0A9N8I121_9STRA|nr:acid type B receptor subunit 2 [Seminavis robusta]|eukprot:Sro3052_g342840.1 acid type B receptor subunit 2 (758) ;mRNA; f:2959-5720
MSRHGFLRAILLLQCVFVLLLGPSLGADPEIFPAAISLRAAVLNAPPFAIVDRGDGSDDDISYQGFQIDLLESMKIFAAQDNVTLKVSLSPAPTQYNDALDLVANDCTSKGYNASKCEAFDLIIADFWSTHDRSMRVDFTPPWLRTTISTVKFVGKSGKDYTTLQEALQAQVPVCVPAGTYLRTVVYNRHPGMHFLDCPSQDECFQALKDEKCVLYAEDELLIRYRASSDRTLELTRESFNTQYMVWPIHDRLPPMVARLMKKWVYRAVGNQTTDALFNKYFQKDQYCPVGTAGKNCDLPCDPNHGASDASGACLCQSTKWTGDDCSIEEPEDLNLLPPGLLITSYVLVTINFVLVAACGLWLMVHRNRAHVKISQPSFLVLILLGCIISSSTILALAQEDEGDGPVGACMLIPWMYSVGFSITFATLFAKILRLFILMRSAAEMRRVTVSLQGTLGLVALVLLVDVSILVAWTVFDPLQWRRTILSEDQLGNPLASQGICVSDSWAIFASIIFAFHLCLMLAACFMCYVTKKIPNRLSNGKFVSIAMFSNLQIMIVAIPVLFVVGSDATTSFFVRSIAIWVNDFVVLALIFGPLVFNVTKFDDANRRSRLQENSTEPIHTGIKQYAEKLRSTRKLSVDNAWGGEKYTVPTFGSRKTNQTATARTNRSSLAVSRDPGMPDSSFKVLPDGNEHDKYIPEEEEEGIEENPSNAGMAAPHAGDVSFIVESSKDSVDTTSARDARKTMNRIQPVRVDKPIE